MTKPVVPTPAAGHKVVEMDAIDVMEWEHGQRTPQASDANLAALVKQSGETAAESAAHKAAVAPRGQTSSPAPAMSTRPRTGDAPGLALPPVPQPGRRNGPAMGPLPAVRASTAPVALPGVRGSTSTPVPGPRAGTAPIALPGVRYGGAMPTGPLPGGRAAAPPPPPDIAPPPPPSVEPPAAPRTTSARSADKPARPGSPSLPFVLRGSAPVLDETPVKLAFRSARPGSQPPAEVPARPAPPTMDETVVARPLRPGAQSFEDVTQRRPSPAGARPVTESAASAAGPAPEGAQWIDQTAPGRPTALAARGAEVSFDEPTRVVRVPASAFAGPAAPTIMAPAPVLPEAAVPLPLPAPVESARIVYPTTAGSFSDVPSIDDRAMPPRITRQGGERRVTTETGNVRSFAPSRRLLWWTGAGASCVAVVAAIVLVGGGSAGPSGAIIAPSSFAPRADEGRPPAAGGAAERASAEPADTVADTVANAAIEPPAPPVAEPAAHAGPAADAPTPVAVVKPAAQANRPRRLGGKKLVVEYSDRGNDAPGLVAQDAEDPAITRARAAYLGGNRKLFSGDVDGAILSYHESIALYPGYVGGYRGLGLAYAQRGDRDQALEALQTYVSAVPSAKDAALIKKRIARLQGK